MTQGAKQRLSEDVAYDETLQNTPRCHTAWHSLIRLQLHHPCHFLFPLLLSLSAKFQSLIKKILFRLKLCDNRKEGPRQLWK